MECRFNHGPHYFCRKIIGNLADALFRPF